MIQIDTDKLLKLLLESKQGSDFILQSLRKQLNVVLVEPSKVVKKVNQTPDIVDYLFREEMWRTRSNTIFKIRTMADNHINRTKTYLHELNLNHPSSIINGKYPINWLKIFQKELDYRKAKLNA